MNTYFFRRSKASMRRDFGRARFMRMVMGQKKSLSVLPDDAAADAAVLKLRYGDAAVLAELRAVEIQHIRSLRAHTRDAGGNYRG